MVVQQLCTKHDDLHLGNFNHGVKWERNGKVEGLTVLLYLGAVGLWSATSRRTA